MTTGQNAWHKRGLMAVLWALGAPAGAAQLTLLVQQPNQQALGDVAVSATPLGQEMPPASSAVAQVAQRQRQFVPYVTVVQRGTVVNFPNQDETRHHGYSFSSPKKFDLQLYKGGSTKAVTFDRVGVVALGCNIHDWMLGYIWVVDTPYFGKTDQTGQWRLNLPAGQYQLQLWHPQMKQPKLMQVRMGDADQRLSTVLRLELSDPRRPAEPALSSGYDD